MIDPVKWSAFLTLISKPKVNILVLAQEDELDEAKEWIRLFYIETINPRFQRSLKYLVYKDEDINTLRSKYITQEQPYFIIKELYYWVFVNKDITRKIGLTSIDRLDNLEGSHVNLDKELYTDEALTVLFTDVSKYWLKVSSEHLLVSDLMLLPTLENIKYIYFSMCNHSSAIYSFSVLINGILITYFPGCVEFMEWGIDVYYAELASESYYIIEDPKMLFEFDHNSSEFPAFMSWKYGIEFDNEPGFKTTYECNPEDDRIPPKILEELKK